MGFSCGIVGLPNVGKSTLFNALTQTAAAEAANFPFCTIEPNVGKVSVPDARLHDLSTISKSEKTLPAQLDFVDIAGLVKGASTGEGLGNKFLSHIREVDAIGHVVRCFEDGNITHVEGNVDPLRDIETIETELVLADLESLEKRIPNLEKKIRGQDKEAKADLALIQAVLPLLEEGKPARIYEPNDPEEAKRFTMLQLITSKPIMFICNVSEDEAENGNEHSARVMEYAKAHNAPALIISAQIEEEIASLDSDDEKTEFLESLGLSETGLARIIRAGYELLGLETYFTSGPKETRAWTIHKHTAAPQAAGKIHTDFEKGFIKAEVIPFKDFIDLGGETGARDAGKQRQEGKDYIVQDGDVIHFKFNV